MPRKKAPVLTGRELEIMKVVWEMGRATVAEVRAALYPETKLAYTTILTLMRILEQKGFLEHKTQGRAYLYSPRITQKKAKRLLVRDLLERAFDGSAELLLVSLIEDGNLSPKDLERIKKAISPSP
jgi:predicted transcriptional regulator